MRTMALVAVVFLAGFAGVASGQPSLYYASGDESGNGFISIPGVFVGPVQGVLLPDPLNGGVQALTYVIPIPNLFVPGDLILHEGITTQDSDWLRFELIGNISSNVVFYSDNSDGSDSLADLLGLPSESVLQPNSIEFLEQGTEGGWSGLVYTPIATPQGIWPGWPGYVLGIPGFTYNITSDVPEPATMTLLALGLGAALLRRRMK